MKMASVADSGCSLSDVHFKLGLLSCAYLFLGMLSVTADCGFRLLGTHFQGSGDARDVWEVRWGSGQGRSPTLQQELTVIDDSGSSRRSAEQSPSRSGGVVLGHVGSIENGHPPDSWYVAAFGALVAR